MNQAIKYSELRRRIVVGEPVTLTEMILAAGLDPGDPESVSPTITEANFPLDREEPYDASRYLFLNDKGRRQTIAQIRRQIATITGPLGSLYDHPGGLVLGLAFLGDYYEKGWLPKDLWELGGVVFLGSTCEYEGGLVAPIATPGFEGRPASLEIAWVTPPENSLGDVSYLISQMPPKSGT